MVTNLAGESNTKTFTLKNPLISGVTPASGTIGAAVRISGNYFGASQGKSTVTFNGVEAAVSSWTNTVIMCTIPVGATTGPVLVTNLAGESNEKTFTVKP
jgi:phosphatidylserine decarboxylase